MPLKGINDTARVEAGFIRVPKLSNIHPYLARRPTAPARALTLASILPESASKDEFIRAIGLDNVASAPFKLLYLVNPNRDYVKDIVKKYVGKDPSQIIVVDPMAGGGSIPLEALRLGFRTIAMDYNPVAYILLKATLKYPAKYGPQLYEDVKKEIEKLIDWAGKELAQYYSSDIYMRHIVARGYRCPNCGGIIPIIYTNKLGKEGPYIKLIVNREKKNFNIEVSHEVTSFERLRCPYCSAPINEDIALRNWVKNHKELLRIALSGDVDRAKEKINELLETHIILAKETPQGFKPADETDRQVFIKAYLDLTSQINELKEYLPDAQIPKENEVFKPIRDLGIEYWYELFNPRQLLILLKLMRYVRMRAAELIKEKGEYGAAIALYLVLGMNKLADYNNIATEWDAYQESIDRLSGRYQEKGRTVDLGLEYCETDIIETLKWVFEPHITRVAGTAGGVLPVLRVLSEWLTGLGNLVDVICGDARNLNAILKDRDIKSVDVINVDPPYLAQHFYSDLMEFFWQFLRIMLQPIIDEGFLFNRDPVRGKVELYIENWSPYLPILPREAEIIARKGRDEIKDLGKKDLGLIERAAFTGDWYVLRMWEFFEEVNKTLKDDGILVVWFTHSDPRAWEAIIASAYAAGFALSKAWTIWTEMAIRRVALLTSAFLTSLALVFRKRSVLGDITAYSNKAEEIAREEEMRKIIRQNIIEDAVKDMNSEASGPEMFIMALASGIASATRIWSPSIDDIREQDSSKIRFTRFRRALYFFDNVLYPAAMYIALETLLEDYLAKSGLSENMRADIMLIDKISRAYLMLWTSSRYAGSRDLAYDFIEKVCKIMNISVDALVGRGLLKKPSKSNNYYSLLFGNECYDAVKGKVDILTTTNVGRAIHVLRLIGEMERKEDATKVAQNIMSRIPLSRSVTATALFLLRTATLEELRLVEIQNDIIKRFAENVLLTLYKGP